MPIIFLVLTFPVPFQPFPLVLLLSLVILIPLLQPEVGKEDGVEATLTAQPENLILKLLTLSFNDIAFSSSDPPWPDYSRYLVLMTL